MRTCVVLTAVGLSLLGWTDIRPALGQFQVPQNSLAFDDTGTLEEVSQDIIKIRDSKTDAWYLRINDDTKIIVQGEAEEECLRPGLTVELNGQVDKKGALTKPVTEIEIISAHGKPSFGLFPPEESDEDARPVRNPGAGTYRIRGKLALFRDGELAVAVGGNRKVTGDIAEKLTVKLNIDDPSVAQAGDEVHVKAWYTDRTKPILNKPGEALAEEVTIKLAKPLAHSGRKARASTEKPAKPIIKSTRSTKN